MSTLIPENFETVAPTEADARLALESSRRLATRKFGKRASVRIRLDDDGEIRFVPIADGRGPGISAFDVRVVDRERVLAAAKKRHKQHGPAQVEICGCRINLV